MSALVWCLPNFLAENVKVNGEWFLAENVKDCGMMMLHFLAENVNDYEMESDSDSSGSLKVPQQVSANLPCTSCHEYDWLAMLQMETGIGLHPVL